MRIVDSLQGRVALAAAASLALVLVVVGVLLVRSTAGEDRRQLDRRLDRRAELLASTAARFGGVAGAEQRFPQLGQIGDTILSTGQTGIRVFRDGRLALAIGDAPTTGLPAAAAPGLSTIEAVDGSRWRVAARDVPGRSGRIEVMSPLGPLEERADSLERRMLLFGVSGVLGAGVLAAVAAGVVLRPLARLRATAEHVADTRALAVRAPSEGTRETRAVAASLNRMLGRLQSADDGTRRFVADAGHELRTPLATIGAALETLDRNPELEPEVRREIVTEAIADQRRMSGLVEALQALARGDAGPFGDEQRVELAEIVAASVAAARTRHPSVAISAAGQGVVIDGSPSGLRTLLDNLLENAAVHGGTRIEVTVAPGRIVVDDDGPGIAPGQRELVLERFHRAPGAGPGGSGLGLALVAQQAARHGGTVEIADAPLGGARVTVTLS